MAVRPAIGIAIGIWQRRPCDFAANAAGTGFIRSHSAHAEIWSRIAHQEKDYLSAVL
jgi:hypothetical protein